jgi:hypothetical protein
MCFYYHSFSYLGGTTGGKVPASLHFYNANAASGRFVFNIEILKVHVT